MWRTLISVFALAVYLSTIFKPVFPVAEYLANKDYIAKVLCINQDKPELSCEGKCHLKKRMVEEQKQSEQESQNVLELKPVSLHLPISNNYAIIPEDYQSNNFIINLDYDFWETTDVFHPPQA